ncbi:MAG: Ig-like domain-containing protein [Bacilli bacterium]|nr:Ig-like domain-containing protein [Bacilli bacterium]
MRKSFISIALAGLLGFGLVLSGCGQTPSSPPTYTVTVAQTSDPDATINGLQSSYKEDDLVTFSVSVNPLVSYKQVDSVTANGSPVTFIGGTYSFSMPAKNVLLNVTLKDARSIELRIEGSTYIVNDEVAYTVLLGGEDVTTDQYTVMTSKPDNAVSFDKANKKMTLNAEGSVTITASAAGKQASRTINVEKDPKVSIHELVEDLLTTPATKNNGYSEKAYEVSSKIVAKGSLSSSNYRDVVIFDGAEYLSCNMNATSSNPWNVGQEVTTIGEVQNYYGLPQLTYNSKGDVKKMEFVEGTGTHTEGDPVALTSDAFNAYIAKCLDANDKSAGTGITSANQFARVSYATVKVTKVISSDGKARLSVDGTSYSISYSKTVDEIKSQIDSQADGTKLTVTGYILGYNSGNSYSNMLIKNVQGIADYLRITNAETTLEKGKTLQMKYTTNVTGDPTWSITSGDAATIDAKGLLTASPTATGKVTVKVALGNLTDSKEIEVIDARTIVASMSFAKKAATSHDYDTSGKTFNEYVEGDLVFRNDQANATTKCADCSSYYHTRCYKGSDLTFTYVTSFSSLELVCEYYSGSTYHLLEGKYTGFTVVSAIETTDAEGRKVVVSTVVLDNATTSFKFNASGNQIRLRAFNLLG